MSKTKKKTLREILDDNFGMFIQDKDNPIYLNIRAKVAEQEIKALLKYKLLTEPLWQILKWLEEVSDENI